MLNQIVNTRVIPEILLGLPFFASVSKAVIKCDNYRVAWFEKVVVQIEMMLKMMMTLIGG